jgi:cyclic-di-GMP phosphodiesterase, flagellum assembly factor TipF
MKRLTAVFVAACMVFIAGSFGAALYYLLGLSAAEASLVSIAAMTGLAVYNAVARRSRDERDISVQIADLSRGTADLARQLGEFGRRLAAAEVKVGTAVDMAVAAAKPVAAEIDELGALVRQLAETVATHDAAIGQVYPVTAAATLRIPEAGVAPGLERGPIENGEIERSRGGEVATPSNAASGRLKTMGRDAVVAMIRDAIEGNRVDVFLQPIVSLPQRKVRFYEALARLRTAEGELLTPSEFLPYAENTGLMPRIDNLVLFRCVQVARRLLSKNRDVGMFCNVSGETLADPEFFAQFSDFLEANRALAPSLVLEFTQAAYRAMGPIENEGLAALANRGFRFSLDNVSDLRVEPRDLAERSFRFLKVSAALLLDRTGRTVSDIHPADLSGLLSRFGLELIGERIESEGVVVDLLDYDVRYGQGLLFSPPRPVRAEIMQTAGDRGAAQRDVAAPAKSGPSEGLPTRSATDKRAALAQRPAAALGQPPQSQSVGQAQRGRVAQG